MTIVLQPILHSPSARSVIDSCQYIIVIINTYKKNKIKFI